MSAAASICPRSRQTSRQSARITTTCRGSWGLQKPLLLYAGRQPGALLAIRNTDLATGEFLPLCATAPEGHLQRNARPVQLRRRGARAGTDRPVQLPLPIPYRATAISPLPSSWASRRWRRHGAHLRGRRGAELSQPAPRLPRQLLPQRIRQADRVSGRRLLPNILPNLTPADQQQLFRRWASTTPTTTVSP